MSSIRWDTGVKHQPGHDTRAAVWTAELTFSKNQGGAVPARRCALDLRPAARAGRPHQLRGGGYPGASGGGAPAPGMAKIGRRVEVRGGCAAIPPAIDPGKPSRPPPGAPAADRLSRSA